MSDQEGANYWLNAVQWYAAECSKREPECRRRTNALFQILSALDWQCFILQRSQRPLRTVFVLQRSSPLRQRTFYRRSARLS